MNSVVDAGELREVCYIQEKKEDFDENGFSQEIYENIYRLRCKVKTQNTSVSEPTIAERDSSKVPLKFICRQRKGITSKMFVLYEGERYNIERVHKMDSHFYEISATMYL